MNKSGLIMNVFKAIQDPKREITDRIYLALSFISEIMVLVALIADVIYKENPFEILVLTGILVYVPTIACVCFYKGWLRFAKKFTVLSLILVVIPALFFLGGGAEGGGVIWIVFVFTYAGLALTGTWRNAMLLLTLLVSLACFITGYYYPQYVYEHTKGVLYADQYVSLVLVGIITFFMTWIQNVFFRKENERAKEAALKAEELNISQNRFFSSMSHEIRTPINSILGLNELILREQGVSDEIIRDASGIQGSGKMLLALINDILDFSKMEAGSMDIVPVDYNIGDMLSEIVNMFWLRANEKGLDFRVTIDPNVPAVLYGDEVRIKQVIINILNNAVKYTSEGYVELHLESEMQDDGSVELSVSVSDSGMGIKKESIPYLFDAFKRVDEAKNRRIEGTGLGLSIVKQLVELMNGTITVNSVYGEGSTFTVELKQGVSDDTPVGELNVHSHNTVSRSRYESSFRAPEAKILIVDDNEMNLEVESKLLADTQMTIHKAIDGKTALELALKNSYDSILMDHLMPEMDGIECLKNLRNQVGGMNRSTPVIVLTANAGSENRELYNWAGFDGYLVKPVSGEALESMLIKYISRDKLTLNNNKMMTASDGITTAEGYAGKVPVLITSTSMCDLPDQIIKKLNIPILPFRIRTDEGIFKDGQQIKADELIRYMNSGKNAASLPPDESSYTEFFAQNLKRAHHVIHIAITTSMSDDYKKALEAAKSFDNVTVINSECLSSSTGILVLIAHKLAQKNISVEEMVSELELVKKRLRCSFIVDSTAYIAKKGHISANIDGFARSFNLHPCLSVSNDKYGIGGVWMGDINKAYRKYIAKAFPVDIIPDPELVFVTYADVPMDTLLMIKEEISKVAYFENVVFKQASAAISSNCGPGSFGILYFVKANKTYNLSSYFVSAKSEAEDELTGYDRSGENGAANEDEEAAEGLADNGSDVTDTVDNGTDEAGSGYGRNAADGSDEAESGYGRSVKSGISGKDGFGDHQSGRGSVGESAWYENIPGIDGSVALKNSGSEESLKMVLQLFYDNIEAKAAELDGFYKSEDWKNYTIKVHAMKSSVRLIGAEETAVKAELLENAGKEGDTGYIRANHDELLEEYSKYRELLAGVFGKAADTEEDRPVADEFLMECLYEEFLNAAENMDCDALEEIPKQLEGYAIPEDEREKYDSVIALAEALDYNGIVELLKGNDP